MGLGIGGIVSLGSTGGSSSGGSGIQTINGQSGPDVILVGTSGIIIDVVAPNQINIGISGVINTSQSGVIGVNGITVHQINGNFVVDGIALSGQSGNNSSSDHACFEQTFAATTSGFFAHNLGTRSLVVQIADDSQPPMAIMPDAIVFDTLDAISVLFNTPQAGIITILTCGTTASGVQKFSQALTAVTAVSVVHSLGSEDVIVQIRDTNQDVVLPDRIRILDLNTVSLQFNDSFSGRVVIVG